jgi:hypothetical protein
VERLLKYAAPLLLLIFLYTTGDAETKAKPNRAMVTGIVEESQPGTSKGKVEFSLASGCNTVLDSRIATGKAKAPKGYYPIKPGVWKAIKLLAKRFGHVEVSCLEIGHSKFVAGTNSVSDHFVGGGLDIAAVGKTRITYAMQMNRPATIKLIENICRKAGAWQMVAYQWHNVPGAIAAGNHDDHVHCGFRR